MIRQKLSAAIHLGLDIGGTKVEIGLFDRNFNMVDSWRVQTPTDDYSSFISILNTSIEEAENKTKNSLTIGIGMPGIIDKQGLVKSANVPCATGKPLLEDFNKLISKNIVIGNDCQLFALSEANGGAANALPVVFGAIIGTGAGGGLCVNGQLFKTTNNIAGEYGHLPVSGHLLAKYNLPVRPCGCGLIGCAESYIAGPGLAWLYQHLGAEKASTHLLIKHLREGEQIAIKTFNCFIDLLGSSIASLILSYDPDMIVIGGGLSKIDEIFDALPNATKQHLFDCVDVPKICPAKYGDSSGVRGAAILGALHAKKV